MTLWIFGDSYASSCYDTKNDVLNPYDSWYTLLGNSLEQEVCNYGKNGSSLSYTYHMFNKARDNIKENDIVIITITDLNRRWLFVDKPYQTVLSEFNRVFKKNHTPEVLNAVKQYIIHLNNNSDLEITYLLNFLYNLYSITKELNLHTIILPVLEYEEILLKNIREKFPLFNFSEGFLYKVTRSQYETNFFENIIENLAYDGMKNHLLKSNHHILKRKILDNIKYRSIINLNEGFYYGSINSQSVKNHKIFQEEFLTYPEYYK